MDLVIYDSWGTVVAEPIIGSLQQFSVFCVHDFLLMNRYFSQTSIWNYISIGNIAFGFHCLKKTRFLTMVRLPDGPSLCLMMFLMNGWVFGATNLPQQLVQQMATCWSHSPVIFLLHFLGQRGKILRTHDIEFALFCLFCHFVLLSTRKNNRNSVVYLFQLNSLWISWMEEASSYCVDGR